MEKREIILVLTITIILMAISITPITNKKLPSVQNLKLTTLTYQSTPVPPPLTPPIANPPPEEPSSDEGELPTINLPTSGGDEGSQSSESSAQIQRKKSPKAKVKLDSVSSVEFETDQLEKSYLPDIISIITNLESSSKDSFLLWNLENYMSNLKETTRKEPHNIEVKRSAPKTVQVLVIDNSKLAAQLTVSPGIYDLNFY